MDLQKITVITDFINVKLLPVNTQLLDENTNLFELGLDSLRIMRLISFLEQELNITIKDEDIKSENLKSLSSIITLVKTYLNR